MDVLSVVLLLAPTNPLPVPPCSEEEEEEEEEQEKQLDDQYHLKQHIQTFPAPVPIPTHLSDTASTLVDTL
jgi:hypothetical protein